MTRRRFLGATTAAATATGLYGWQFETRWVKYERYTLPIPNLPTELVGRTLVQISDLHIGDRIDYRYQFRHFDAVTAAQPDYVVYTGDYISYSDADQLDQLATAAQHFPHGRFGTAAITGNHDYGHGWSDLAVADTISSILTDNGLTMLRNQVTQFDGLQLIGVNDLWSPAFDDGRVIGTADLTQPTIVLVHNPDAVELPIWHSFQGAILCGHTHGGQVKPPFLPPPILPIVHKQYAEGMFELGDGRTLYVNRGLGHVQQIRFNARPEITWFTLARA